MAVVYFNQRLECAEIVILSMFYAKKLKNKNSGKNKFDAKFTKKKKFFKFASKCWLSVLFPTLKLFCIKNAENDFFDQCLGCAAPKHWLKYTTDGQWQVSKSI